MEIEIFLFPKLLVAVFTSVEMVMMFNVYMSIKMGFVGEVHKTIGVFTYEWFGVVRMGDKVSFKMTESFILVIT